LAIVVFRFAIRLGRGNAEIDLLALAVGHFVDEFNRVRALMQLRQRLTANPRHR
jgi:hypothetical protein